MNSIIDVCVEMNLGSKMRPKVYCLFDSLETDLLIFDQAGYPIDEITSRFGEVLLKTIDISSFSLLAISNDLAVWYYYSAVNRHGAYQNTSLKIRKDNEVVEELFEGLWMSSAEATNFWFPKTQVMTITATDQEDEFRNLIGQPLGAVASVVVEHLKQQGCPVGWVSNDDGYKDVEPLMPDGTAKNGKVLKIL